jgi:hypothetical protein
VGWKSSASILTANAFARALYKRTSENKSKESTAAKIHVPIVYNACQASGNLAESDTI